MSEKIQVKRVRFGMNEKAFKEACESLLIPVIEFMEHACPKGASFRVTRDGAEFSCALFEISEVSQEDEVDSSVAH